VNSSDDFSKYIPYFESTYLAYSLISHPPSIKRNKELATGNPSKYASPLIVPSPASIMSPLILPVEYNSSLKQVSILMDGA